MTAKASRWHLVHCGVQLKRFILSKSIVDSVAISSAGTVSAVRSSEETVNFSLISCSY